MTTRLVVLLSVFWLLGPHFGYAEGTVDAVVEVENFRATYAARPTPSEGWGNPEEEEKWVVGFEGKLESKRPLAYRNNTIPAGTHAVWIEKGSDEWFHLLVGDPQDGDAPRLKAMFKLYELEDGVDVLRFELKVTRRGKKLKFSIFAGKSEGHGNLRIVEG